MRMHIRTLANHTERESRLLRFAGEIQDISTAAESRDAFEAANKNPALKQVLDIYDNPLMRSKHPILRNAVDRSYFIALLLDKTVSTAVPPKSYKETVRADIRNPILPTGMFPDVVVPGGGVPPVANAVDVGNRANAFMSKENFAKLSSNPSAMAQAGQAYLNQLAAYQPKWNAGQVPTPQEQLLVDTVVDYYAFCRTSLNKILEDNHILVPEEQRAGSYLSAGLERAEYFQLLSLMWDGKATDIAAAATKGTEALRTFIGIPANVASTKRANEIYTDRSFRELGPNETLNRFGVTLGPSLTFDYHAARAGKDAIPSAQTWIARPDHAIAFLDGRLPKTEGNAKFLTALRGLQEGKLADPANPDPNVIKPDDVRSMLALVAQSCMEYEQVVNRSKDERDKMIASGKLGLDGKLEQGGKDLWKFMLDFQKHPIASGILWLGAAFAAKIAWDALTKPSSRIMRWIFLAAMGGTGLALYQQHKTGRSWFSDLTKSTTDYMEKDKAKPVEKQVFVNYWRQQLKLDSNKTQSESVIASLQDQPVSLVVKWYEDYRTGQTKTLPPEFGTKYRAMFGEMDSKERAKVFYEFLTKFFEDRGDYVLKHHMDGMYNQPGTAVKDTAQLGYEYMRDKYVNQIVYEVIATNFLEHFKIELGGGTPLVIEAADLNLGAGNILERPDVKALMTANPKAYAMLERFLAEYRPVGKVRDSANWNMMHVFYHESDPEILRRMGQDEAAGPLEKMRAAAGI